MDFIYIYFDSFIIYLDYSRQKAQQEQYDAAFALLNINIGDLYPENERWKDDQSGTYFLLF